MLIEDQELSELQQGIEKSLRSQRAVPRDKKLLEFAEQHLTGNSSLTPAEQLDIYRQQYWLRHSASLVEDFPGVGGILGQAEWEQLVESYLARFPPESWTLRDLGDRLEQHIRARPETPHQQLCGDMAALEWIYVELFDAPECPALDGEKLGGIPEDAWQRARIAFHPALRLLTTAYPVATLRRQLRASANTGESVAIPAPYRQRLALYRGRDRSLYYKPLTETAHALLERLMAGTPLVPACEELVATHQAAETEIEESIGGWFQLWGAEGWIVDVEQPNIQD